MILLGHDVQTDQGNEDDLIASSTSDEAFQNFMRSHFSPAKLVDLIKKFKLVKHSREN